MLRLACPTPARWLNQVENQLDLLLIDHAHCEKKAAGTAMNLIFHYVEHEDLCRALSEIVREELEHFNLVLDILKDRGVRFKRLPPSSYGGKLNEQVARQEPQRAIDRMLVAALIEARSCERFGLLAEHLQNREPALAKFFASLFESEARHHSTYIKFAHLFGTEQTVAARLEDLAAAEAQIIHEGHPEPRMHS